MSYFSIKVYHGGRFGLQGEPLHYLGGQTIIYDNCDEDKWSLLEVVDMVTSIGYMKNGIAAMWFKSLTENTEDGLKMLRTDKDAMELAKIGVRDGMVELYVVLKKGFCKSPCTIEEIEVHELVRASAELEGSESGSDDDSQDDDFEPKSDDSDSEEPWSDTESEDSAHDIAFDDSDDEGNADGGLFDVEVNGMAEDESLLLEQHVEATTNVKKVKEVMMAGLRDEDDGYDSDELPDLPSSDEEGHIALKRYPLHKDLKDMSQYKWDVGTLYVSRDQFKECVISVAVHSARGLRFKKCDERRVKVVCVKGCSWTAYCAKLTREDTWQLKSCINKHVCSKATRIGIMHAKWLSKAFRRKIAENPNIKLSTLMKKTHSKWNVDLTRSKAARVKQHALEEINGTFGEQYKRLYDYGAELLKANPGSSVSIQVQRPYEFALERPPPGKDMRPTFERIYICLDACKKSFMVCRPMIGLDGCFIKTPYEGQLLTAIGWDPNDQILPIAYAVVEAETKDSWTWFLINLCNDLGVDKIKQCTFISDQQKGLIPTFEELLPGIDHRFCVRHLYNNFRKRFPGVQLKIMMWRASKATYVQEWERRMADIQKLNKEAYKHLMEISPKYWTKSRFSYLPRCDALCNNMCECFNSVMVAAREKSIVSMLEDIRVYLMNRWADNRESIIGYTGDVWPKIKKKIEKKSLIRVGIGWLYMLEKISMRKFQLVGIPCEHAMACIRKMSFDASNYVANCYKKEAYVKCYEHVIYPVNGPNLWEKTQHNDVLPPMFRTPIGRPKKSRNKANDKPTTGARSTLSRDGQQQKCSYCFANGHNKRTCPKKCRVQPSSISVASIVSSKKIMPQKQRPPPKRKQSSQAVSTQQSQTASKKARRYTSKTKSHQHSLSHTSPSKRVLKYMAKTPPKAWKSIQSQL